MHAFHLSCHLNIITRGWLGLARGGAEEGAGSGDGGGGNSKAVGAFRAVAGSPAFAMGDWGTARALGVSWLDSLVTWLEATEAWPAAEKATLRMEDVRT